MAGQDTGRKEKGREETRDQVKLYRAMARVARAANSGLSCRIRPGPKRCTFRVGMRAMRNEGDDKENTAQKHVTKRRTAASSFEEESSRMVKGPRARRKSAVSTVAMSERALCVCVCVEPG